MTTMTKLLALGVAFPVFAAAPARADIIYTWQETDSQYVTGSLDVLSVSQVQGVIDPADVVSFAFFVGSVGGWHSPYTTIPALPISTLNADFTATPGSADSYIYAFTAPLGDVYVATDSNNALRTETWNVSSILGDYSGRGYWSISGASAVPEPTSLVLLAWGGSAMICYACTVVRRPEGRKTTGG